MTEQKIEHLGRWLLRALGSLFLLLAAYLAYQPEASVTDAALYCLFVAVILFLVGQFASPRIAKFCGIILTEWP